MYDENKVIRMDGDNEKATTMQRVLFHSLTLCGHAQHMYNAQGPDSASHLRFVPYVSLSL